MRRSSVRERSRSVGRAENGHVLDGVEKRLYPYEDCSHDAGRALDHERIVMEFMADHLRV